MESRLNTSMCHKWTPLHHLPLAVISKATDGRLLLKNLHNTVFKIKQSKIL